MQLQIEFWQLVSIAGGCIVFMGGICAALGKALLSQADARLEQRFNSQEQSQAVHRAAQEQSQAAHRVVLDGRLQAIEHVTREETLLAQRLQTQLLELKAELPIHYVRREDYIRGQTVIEAKLDGLAVRMENMRLRRSSDASS